MYIIGHRGAAGLSPENTIAGIITARNLGVDAVEFDVQLTKDNELILHHDADLSRMTGNALKVRDLTVQEIQKHKTLTGEPIPTLGQALKAAGTMPVVVEPKGGAWAEPLVKALKGYEHIGSLRVISFNHPELHKFGKLHPDIPLYAIEKTSPFEVIQTARKLKFAGIDVNFWILNPLTYWLAKRLGLKIIVYTVDKAWIARFLNFFFPDISITTNVPHLLDSRFSLKNLREKAKDKALTKRSR